jgi:hypothetical protein
MGLPKICPECSGINGGHLMTCTRPFVLCCKLLGLATFGAVMFLAGSILW